MPFAISIGLLGLVQAALVVLPGALPRLPLAGLSSRWWALAPALSIVIVIVIVNFYSPSATALSWLALVGVPPLAAVALALLVRGARPAWALAALALLALAWTDPSSLVGEAAATALSALACISLGRLLVSIVPAQWLRLGIYAMAAVDTWLVATDLLQGPNSVLSIASPAAGLPRLQAVHLGSAAMGFGDLFVAALVGCLLADRAEGKTLPSSQGIPAGQRMGAALVAILALGFDLLFFAVDELPATVPVAVALALVQRQGAKGGRQRRQTLRKPRPADPRG
ncbi:MAG: hypothetical protein ACHQCF_04355 [Solirubrobacterales bacterium]